MKEYEVRWSELQKFHTIVKAKNKADAIRKVTEGDYEESHDSGNAPTSHIYDVEEL